MEQTPPLVLHRSRSAIIFQGDARDILPTLRFRSVDLVVTDPPYGQKYKGDNFPAMAGDDGSLDVVGILRLTLKPLWEGRHLYVFGPALELPATEPVRLVWDKCHLGRGPMELVWAKAHEDINFYVNRTGKNKADGKGRLAARLRRGSVLRVPRLTGVSNSRHPTEKPVLLMRHIIESSSLLGDTVLDPFAGSGSTLVAAIVSGRRAVGIEIDPGYAQVMVDRVKQAEALALGMEGL